MSWRAAAAFWAALPVLSGGSPELPWIDRIEPLSAQRGTTIRVELHGEHLKDLQSADFGTDSIQWLKTVETAEKRIVGEVRVSADAPLGPHGFYLRGKGAPSNARLFNVTQWPTIAEAEPNDRAAQAQRIELRPQSIQGYMKGLIDVDVYTFNARAGERWVFDLRSLEYGTHLESEMVLLDAAGKRAAENDDRDEFDESPLLEHTFSSSGRYYLKLDQYRGPQGVSCDDNCGYSLEISQLPLIRAVSPLGARLGTAVRFRLEGTAIESVTGIALSPARSAEHYRMTYPFTMPVRFGHDPRRSGDTLRITGRIVERSRDTAVAEVSIPADVPTGLWRASVTGPSGEAPAISLEIGDAPELDEQTASSGDWRTGEFIVNGRLSRDGEEDRFTVVAEAGKPLRFWTLAAQLGLPEIDTVLELRDESGKIVSSHDDVMSGQGTPVGNPDSSLVYVPATSGKLTLSVRDRIARGGPGFVYRLHVKSEHPGFQLLTSPENFALRRGSSEKLTVFLIREPGFEGEVPVWFEGLPSGITAEKGTFRADQAFGPSADGDNMIIPEMSLSIAASAEVAPGEYPLRLVGRGGPGGRIVLAHTSLWIGPPRNRNDTRRPRPAVVANVIE